MLWFVILFWKISLWAWWFIGPIICAISYQSIMRLADKCSWQYKAKLLMMKNTSWLHFHLTNLLKLENMKIIVSKLALRSYQHKIQTVHPSKLHSSYRFTITGKSTHIFLSLQILSWQWGGFIFLMISQSRGRMKQWRKGRAAESSLWMMEVYICLSPVLFWAASLSEHAPDEPSQGVERAVITGRLEGCSITQTAHGGVRRTRRICLQVSGPS